MRVVSNPWSKPRERVAHAHPSGNAGIARTMRRHTFAPVNRADPTDLQHLHVKHITDTSITQTQKKSLILDAAAEIFAELEFHGTSMRMVAERAGVAQSLIHYHYKTKEQLFEEVFERHIGRVNDERLKLLKQFLASDQPHADTDLEKLLLIIVKPWVDVTRDADRPTREFARYIIRSAYHQDEWSLKLAGDHFVELRQLVVQAFLKLFPAFDEGDCLQAYYLTLSMFFMPLTAPDRLSTLSGKKSPVFEPDSLLEVGIRFAAAGIRSIRAS
jgi:AcrR family transcriptional regulator